MEAEWRIADYLVEGTMANRAEEKLSCSVNRRIRGPYVRWCEGFGMANQSPLATRFPHINCLAQKRDHMFLLWNKTTVVAHSHTSKAEGRDFHCPWY